MNTIMTTNQNWFTARMRRLEDLPVWILALLTRQWKESEEGSTLLEKARRECERLEVRPLRKSAVSGMTPGEFLADVAGRLLSPLAHPRTMAVTFVVAAMFGTAYLVLFAVAALRSPERQAGS